MTNENQGACLLSSLTHSWMIDGNYLLFLRQLPTPYWNKISATFLQRILFSFLESFALINHWFPYMFCLLLLDSLLRWKYSIMKQRAKFKHGSSLTGHQSTSGAKCHMTADSCQSRGPNLESGEKINFFRFSRKRWTAKESREISRFGRLFCD